MELSVYINDPSSTSEIFLYQLLNKLNERHKIEVISYKQKDKSKLNRNIKSKIIPPPLSLRFTASILYLFVKYRTGDIRLLYHLFVLEQAKSSKIYFPFLYMFATYTNVIKTFTEKNPEKAFYSSIRGTEITVNPFIKSNALSDYRKVLPFAKKIHFLSEHLFEQFNKLSLKAGDYSIIYQGVDFEKFNILNSKTIPRDKLRMVTVGRFDFIKGIEYLIYSCYLLKKMNIDFQCTIIGYGPEKLKYLFMINDLGLVPNVIIHDTVSHEDLRRLLQQHNLYVHTHLVTGISNTMLEAFSCALPVIAFNSEFDSYKIKNLNTYFKECERYNSFALAELLQQFDFTQSIPFDDINMILQKFTLQNQADQFIDFFDFV